MNTKNEQMKLQEYKVLDKYLSIATCLWVVTGLLSGITLIIEARFILFQ